MIRPLAAGLALMLLYSIGDVRAQERPPEDQPSAQEDGEAGDRPSEESEGLSLGAELSLHSTFIYRGLPLSAGPIAQPYVYLTFEDLTLDAYAIPSLNETDGLGHLIEFGVSVSYDALTFSGFAVAPTLFLYGTPEDGSVLLSGELELLLSLELGPIELYLENAFALIHPDERRGFWTEFGISHENSLTADLSLASKLGIAAATGRWNRFNAGVSTRRFGFNGVDLESTLEYAISEFIHTSLTGELVFPFLRRLAGGDAVIVNIGAALGVHW